MPAGLDGNPDPIVTAQRTEVLTGAARAIAGMRSPDRPCLVAVDGIDGAGKSTFADELGVLLRESGRHVVRSTIDSFHNPRSQRLKRGRTSPVGFYLDSHDLDGLRARLLDPFHTGVGSYVTAMFDEPTDSAVEAAPQQVETDAILVFDGIFLQRPELAPYWDLVIYLDAQQRVNMRRLEFVIEDLPSDPMDVVAHVLDWQAKIDRYASGMRYYLDLVEPATRADVVIDNNDLARPRIVRPA